MKHLKDDYYVVNEFAVDERGLLGWKVSLKNDTDASGPRVEEILYSEELVAVILKYGK